MNEQKSNELFSMQLNRAGIDQLLRFSRLTKIFFVIAGVGTLLLITTHVIVMLDDKTEYEDSIFGFFIRFYPLLYLAISIIYIIQLSVYLRLSLTIDRVVKNPEENSLNIFLNELSRAMVYAIIISSLSFILTAFELVITIKYRV